MTFEEAKSRIQGPAIGMIVVGFIDIMLQLFNLLYYGAAGAAGIMLALEEQKPDAMIVLGLGMLGICIGILGLLIGIFLVYTGFKLCKVRNYQMGRIASILLMLPLLNCCILGLPFGIWCLVVLNDEEVKAAFSHQEQNSG